MSSNINSPTRNIITIEDPVEIRLPLIRQIQVNAEVGLTWTGALAQRDFDVLGVLITHAVLSDEDGAGFDGDETAVELFYKVQVTPAFSLKPDLQWIVNPGGDPSVDDALMATLRAEIVL